ncbi:MAG: alpha/beta fold hydrolase [Chitinispirillaceae bacterium]|nr:alpha/beta fold hydrolase [Chitinispirillaceae bacterium]
MNRHGQRAVSTTTRALFPITLAVCGCMSLDPFLFKGEEVDAYLFDEYGGAMECADALDSLGPVDMSTVHELSIESGAERIAAVLVADRTSFDSTDTVILYIHGTGPHIDYYWPRTRLLASTGYPVLAIDFRGYGRSTGEPTEAGIYEDGFSALRFLRDECGDPRVVVYAFSLGSLVGCEIASGDESGRVISLILESPIGSVETLVQDAAYIDLPGSYVTTYQGKNVEKIKKVIVPLLWLHGTDDETLALETNGRPVYRNYRGGEGYYAIIDNAGHRTVPTAIGYDRYHACIQDFISGHAAQNPLLSTELE